MENTPAKLSPRELFQLKWLLGGALAVVSMWSVLTLGIGAQLLAAGLMVAVATSLAFPRLPGGIPPLVWKIVPTLLLVFILGDFVLSAPDFLAPLVRALVVLLGFRALEYRRRRHDLQLVLLGLFLVIITGVLSMELSFAVQVIAFTPLAMLVLFTVTLSETASQEAQEVPEDAWHGFRWRILARRLRAVIDRRLLVLSGALFVGLAISAGLMFVALPRFELGQALPFLRLQSQQSLSGFSETVEFGDVVNIIQDDRVALRADVEGARPREVPYWRMMALDSYEGRRFQVSDSAREAHRQFSDHRLEVSREGIPPDMAVRWTVYFEGGVARFLPLPGHFSSIRFQSRQNLIYNAWLHIFGLREVPGSVLSYQMEELVQSARTPGSSADQALIGRVAESAGLTGRHAAWRYPATTLAVPDDAATQATLDRVLDSIVGEELITAEVFAERATQWLHQRHGYSLSSTIPSGPEDPLVRWMDRGKGGHCELFAGAFVLLARHAGYPARLVTGFHGGDWNGYENYFMVRNAHAHAWVELFDGKSHWLRVDPTPGSGRPGAPASGDAEDGSGWSGFDDRTFGAYLDSLRILWYRRVVNFDQRQQRDLMTGLRDRLTDGVSTVRGLLQSAYDTLKDKLAGSWTWGGALTSGIYVLSGLILIALGLLLARLRPKGGRHLTKAHSNRIRRRAGKWLQRLGTASSAPAELRGQLLALRYDNADNWPDPAPVFKSAARASRHKGSHTGARPHAQLD